MKVPISSIIIARILNQLFLARYVITLHVSWTNYSSADYSFITVYIEGYTLHVALQISYNSKIQR